jgi:TetR/AcrR family transcriptional repressor of nem operon
VARPREFKIEDAVAGAMNVFWAKGYGDASLPELLDGMQITRGSLYKAFGDKKSLFLQVLSRYEEEVVAPTEAALADPARPGRDRIIAVFEGMVDVAATGDRRGCLLCSAAAGPAAEDVDISRIVQALLTRVQVAFRDAAGDEDLARMLVSHYVGARTLVRAGAPLADLRAGVVALGRYLPSGDTNP